MRGYENIVKRAEGLPKYLQDEIYHATINILTDYAIMKKSHMNYDRMLCLATESVHYAMVDAWNRTHET